MRQKNLLMHLVVAGLLGVTLFVETSQRAYAIPAFARRYNTSCFTCHTSEPLLNEFGRRFQASGYQLPGTREKTSIWDQSPFPVALVAAPMVAHTTEKDNISGMSTTTNAFSGIELGVFSSGSLGSHLSFFTEFPILTEGGKTEIHIEDAHLIYTDVLGNGLGNLNFRVGKMRLFIPFLPNVILKNAGPLVYDYNPLEGKTANDLIFGEPTFGTSAFGILPQAFDGLRWELGITGGTKSDVDLKSARAVFAALNQTVFLSNAPFRFGAFFYGGSQDVTDASVSPTPWSNRVARLGIDAEIYDPWTKRLDLYGQYIYAKDDNIDNANDELRMDGGFIGLNVVLMPERLYVYGRYDFMKVKQTNDAQRQIDLGLQYHLLPNVVLFGVFTSTNETIPETMDQTKTSFGIGALFGF